MWQLIVIKNYGNKCDDDDNEDNYSDNYDYLWGYLIIFLYFDNCREHEKLMIVDFNFVYIIALQTSPIVKLVGCIYLNET